MSNVIKTPFAKFWHNLRYYLLAWHHAMNRIAPCQNISMKKNYTFCNYDFFVLHRLDVQLKKNDGFKITFLFSQRNEILALLEAIFCLIWFFTFFLYVCVKYHCIVFKLFKGYFGNNFFNWGGICIATAGSKQEKQT